MLLDQLSVQGKTQRYYSHTGPFTAIVLTGLLAGCAHMDDADPEREAMQESGSEPGPTILSEKRISQDPGKVTYWVLPGPRALEEPVFGTPDNLKATLEPRLREAEQAEGPASVVDLLRDVPIMVAVPEEARTVNDQGQYVFEQPNPFSDRAEIIEGEFTARLTDRVREDQAGPPGNTPDSAEMTATFTDPAGNDYRVVLDHVVQPPFPGYETGGGVLFDSELHGTTGTGSPLMPNVDTQAAVWGVGELYVNGELVNDHQMMHLMTTEIVRNRDYELVFSEDLPLAPEDRHIRDQSHHTHLLLPPITATEAGPVHSPVATSFELENGEMQPFIHVMFEQDELQDL